MTLADEITRLQELHRGGALTDEEFARAKARVLEGGAPAAGSSAVNAVNGLRRSRGDRWLGGVCGGLARSTALEAWAWRLLFVVLALFGGTGVLAYALLWIFVPEDGSPGG